MRPSAMATSMPSWISPVHTFTSFAPLMTVSAGVRPWATATSVFEHSHKGFLQNALIMAGSFRRRFGCKAGAAIIARRRARRPRFLKDLRRNAQTLRFARAMR